MVLILVQNWWPHAVSADVGKAYLEVMKYDGWIGLDIFPFRMDGRTAADLCIKNLRSLEKILDRLDKDKLIKAMESLDAGNSQSVIRDALFPA